MRPDPQTRALWEMFSDLVDFDDAHRYVADMLAGTDVRYDLGDAHRLVGTLCPDRKLAHRAGPRRRHAGACARHLVRPTGLSAV
jgi:hypothetical protein